MPDQDDAPTLEEFDWYIGMQVLLPREDVYQCTTITHKNLITYGQLIVMHNSNPLLDTILYEV